MPVGEAKWRRSAFGSGYDGAMVFITALRHEFLTLQFPVGGVVRRQSNVK